MLFHSQVWAYANLGVDPGKDLLEAAAKRAQEDMKGYSAQNISNIMWGFARLGYLHEEFIQAAVDHVLLHLADFSPQSMVRRTY